MSLHNPLFEKSHLRDEAVCFSKIKTEHFLPALETAINLAKKNIEAIKQLKEIPSFENTIEALETSGEDVERVSGVFYYLYSAEGPDDLQALAKEMAPRLAAFGSDISLDPVLFEKIKSLYDRRQQLSLNTEQSRLLEKNYKDFVRNGALLNEEQKGKLRALDQELSLLAPKYSENVLKATNKFELLITDDKDLSGLPEGIREAAKNLAQHKGHPHAWLFNLQYPSFGPFMQYSDRRELREIMWKAYNSMCFNDEFDNQEAAQKIVRLRHERAQLLGYKNHASFVLEERMAQNPETVMTFLESLFASYRKAAEKDLQEVIEFKKSMGGDDSLLPWDYGYYAEKLKEKKYHFSSEELRPYFSLEKCIDGMFEHARRLFGLRFETASNVEVYHPDVKVYEVRDAKTNDYVALFYADFFPRETKKSGAWATTLREQGLLNGEVRRPHAAIVCNFTKPTPTKPSLLTYDEVSTLYHEFGHALHMMLSQCRYRSLSGANVYWDFVELPSQIMENWVEQKESLDIFAHHYETGEPLPQILIKKIHDASLFQVGYFSLRQLSFGFLDMAWHNTDPSQFGSLAEFEQKATAKTRLLPLIPGTSVSTHFSHIFAGGYSAGYYSYKWAEVLDADAFEYFKEKGLFNAEVGAKFKECILSRGGTEHPMELYKRFRGREPDTQALLRREGLA
jgi:peptidyl-dipeptidase Dcp